MAYLLGQIAGAFVSTLFLSWVITKLVNRWEKWPNNPQRIVAIHLLSLMLCVTLYSLGRGDGDFISRIESIPRILPQLNLWVYSLSQGFWMAVDLWKRSHKK